MESTLLISLNDILHYTTVGGDVDDVKINPHIYNSQILYIEPILGSELYEKMISLVNTGDINLGGNINYKNLLDIYITPSLVFHTLEFFIPINSFIIADGGTFRLNPTNASYSPMDEIDRLSAKYKIIGNKYDKKLSDYLCKYQTNYIEYQNLDGLVPKTETTNRCGWYLGLSNQTNKIRI